MEIVFVCGIGIPTFTLELNESTIKELSFPLCASSRKVMTLDRGKRATEPDISSSSKQSRVKRLKSIAGWTAPLPCPTLVVRHQLSSVVSE